MRRDAYLVLENGKVFKGKYFGKVGTVISEIVFTTSMGGYIETLTDPSYYGQIVVQTFPLIGNYGVMKEDFESKAVKMSGYIVKHYCEYPSNFRNEGTLEEFLIQQGIVGLCEIDTRALTKIIRTEGTMNGIITDDISNIDFDSIKKYLVNKAVENVASATPVILETANKKYRVGLFDYGYKANIARELIKRDCEVVVLPISTKADDLDKYNLDGIMLSNGPGDPINNSEVISNLKQIITKGIPIFGICLGHQLLALANNFYTKKMVFGHRGTNHPVRNLDGGRIYITSQNHGYAVVKDSIDNKIAKVLFDNVNDGTVEGIEYLNAPIFSVQFHPEACGGARDTNFLFDKFISMIKKNAEVKNAVK
jgi:carbamoyl-phosphate synthase small subunit